MMVEGGKKSPYAVFTIFFAANELWEKKLFSCGAEKHIFENIPAADKVSSHFWTCQR